MKRRLPLLGRQLTPNIDSHSQPCPRDRQQVQPLRDLPPWDQGSSANRPGLHDPGRVPAAVHRPGLHRLVLLLVQPQPGGAPPSSPSMHPTRITASGKQRRSIPRGRGRCCSSGAAGTRHEAGEVYRHRRRSGPDGLRGGDGLRRRDPDSTGCVSPRRAAIQTGLGSARGRSQRLHGRHGSARPAARGMATTKSEDLATPTASLGGAASSMTSTEARDQIRSVAVWGRQQVAGRQGRRCGQRRS